MAKLTATEGRFPVTGSSEVSSILIEPAEPKALLVLGHGAGADMRHASMTSIATELARRDVAVLRFNFPFMESGRGPVNSRSISTATIARAVERAHGLKPALPL